MRSVLPFVVVGLTTGSIYALAAMGLVLTFKTSGIFNFAHGAVGAVAAYGFYELRSLHGVPWPLALLVSVGLVGLAGGLLLERLAHSLRNTATSSRVVASIGLLVGLQGLAVMRYGADAKRPEPFLPRGTLRFVDVNVGVDQLLVVVFVAVSAVALRMFLQRSRLGMAMQAVVEDPDLLALEGTSPTAVRRLAWMIGCCYAGVSGVLLATTVGLDIGLLTLLVVQAFGAAAIGAFDSLLLTYGGGLLVGVLTQLSIRFLGSQPAFQGLPPSMPFLILFVVLLVTPSRRLIQRGTGRPRASAPVAPLPGGVRLAGAAVGTAGLLAVPALVGSRLPIYTQALVYVILFTSLSLLVRTSGQISLCHMAFAAVGASTFIHMTQAGVPWLAAVLIAGLVALPVGAVVSIPAIRLSGIYLAIATYGFGILVQRLFYSRSFMFGSVITGQRAPRPDLPGLDLGSDRGYYYVVLAMVVLCCLVVVGVQRSRLGRLLRALGDSPAALTAQGTNTNLTRLFVFCISAFLAAVAGAVAGPVTGAVSGLGFDFTISLMLVAVLAIAGPRPLLSGFVAAGAYAVVPAYFTGQRAIQLVPVFFGVSAIAMAVVAANPQAIARWCSSRRAGDRVGRSPVASRAPVVEAT
ncbi:MAG TPA: ABC transporter permease [Acidimicrobiia bacterium]|nr:ABC transporter permease [Acidimicrobiia bacterium]